VFLTAKHGSEESGCSSSTTKAAALFGCDGSSKLPVTVPSDPPRPKFVRKAQELFKDELNVYLGG